MKNFAILLFLSLTFTACKNEITTTKEAALEKQEEPNSYIEKEYPDAINSIMKAHGGMEQWDKMNNLCFEMPSKNGAEIHTVSLKDRRTKIEAKDWSIGYDGANVWLLQNKPDAYEGNARFYHNLIFYFYAMPFVLADEGITYEMQEPTQLDGVTYEAVKISYGEGVGDSPEDEYILYFNPESHQMQWLGYTVTYRDNKKSDRWSFIKYGEWQSVNGLLLPKSLTWYTVEDGKPVAVRNTREFEKVVVTETQLDDSVFQQPEGATISPR